ncbi:MAG: bifunctional 5,10-methylenetetrahydrofolate dehydrogenase/5,10-methenyltetrahydrofolate cyclohydrolase [Armatimonadota bacterium]|nr:bifunctional 5,10-methylenetetrahydrofolate dehydrogenase/5,10-methenyltetrahydrofolate cyclohydrolase [Armatimonadota bacterium]
MILDGKALAKRIRDELAETVRTLRASGIVPRLDVLVAAEDPSSLTYVAMKQRWAEQIGIVGTQWTVDGLTSGAWLYDKIDSLNENPDVHGILLQHPLPKHLNEPAALERLGAEKDVDGISPQSLGRLLTGADGFRCATPLGMMRLLDEYNISCEGKHAVVVGRSVILGKPAALMLLERNATVTICHSRTPNLREVCKQADILVAAVGRAGMFDADYVKPGAIVLDAGYNKVEGRKGDVGDVSFESVSPIAGAITPVPGGIGPMTVTMLLSNVVMAASRRL